MIPASFDYVAPTTVEEALAVLAEHGDEAKVLAGGQSLLPVLRMRLNAPERIVDLSRIDALRGVCEDGDQLVIGAMTTHHEVATNPLIREHAAVLAEAASTVARPAIAQRTFMPGRAPSCGSRRNTPTPSSGNEAAMPDTVPSAPAAIPAGMSGSLPMSTGSPSSRYGATFSNGDSLTFRPARLSISAPMRRMTSTGSG